MNDHDTISDQLKAVLSAHGGIKSIMPMTTGKAGRPGHWLVTMHSMDDALNAQSKFGFALYGYTSLIIPDTWLIDILPAE